MRLTWFLIMSLFLAIRGGGGGRVGVGVCVEISFGM